MKEFAAKIQKKISDLTTTLSIRFSKWLNQKVNYFIIAHFLVNKEEQDESDLIIERAISENRLNDLEKKIDSIVKEVDKIQLKKDRQKRFDYVDGKINALNSVIAHIIKDKEDLVIERDILRKKIKSHYQGG